MKNICIALFTILTLALPFFAEARDGMLTSSSYSTEVCTQNGLSTHVQQLAAAEQRYYAAFCMAYYLAVVEAISDAGAWENAMGILKTYNIDLTKDDVDPNRFQGITDFNAYWTSVDKQNYQMAEAERYRRNDVLSKILSVYFTQTLDKGQRLRPSNILALARELKKVGFDASKVNMGPR